jgi:RNA polymerase sigma factor (sigma-70 family)
MIDDHVAEDLLRQLAPQVLSALVRRYGHFDAAEDAVQEALIAAAMQWPHEGVPQNPRGWLIRVASRKLTDQLRSDEARRRREDAVAAWTPYDRLVAPAADLEASHGTGPLTLDPKASAQADDALLLLFLCCHPVLSAESQIALTLRAVGGLTTSEIARAFFVPEATMAQRISRAKQKIKASRVPFEMPPEAQRPERLRTVLHVLYLIFNEGYTASSGPELYRSELSHEAIRLTRQVHKLLPEDGEVTGLLALMLLTDARRPARTGPDGELIPLSEQDRSLWNRDYITEGLQLVTRALKTPTPAGQYQLQAAIAAVHAEAERAEDTDWPQILALYDQLERLADNPMVTLNRAVALAKVHGPQAGLKLLDSLDDPRIKRSHRLDAVRAHLLEQVGDLSAARAAYHAAAQKTESIAEQRYLHGRAARLDQSAP